jgi:hypothetical protein
MKRSSQKCLGVILAALLVSQGMSARGATSELAVAGTVREPPKQTGKTIGGWPVGAYTDNRRIPEALLISGNANQAGLYNLLARNVPSDLEELWILSDTLSGASDPVPVILPNPMEPHCAQTADDLVVNLTKTALAERESAIHYTSAVIEDQAVRVFIGLLAKDDKEALKIARNNLTQRAGLVVTNQYKREEGKDPTYTAFWREVWSRVQEWSTPHKEALLAIGSDLKKDLQEKTIKDPNPSSYTLFHKNREDRRREALSWRGRTTGNYARRHNRPMKSESLDRQLNAGENLAISL